MAGLKRYKGRVAAANRSYASRYADATPITVYAEDYDSAIEKIRAAFRAPRHGETVATVWLDSIDEPNPYTGGVRE